MKQQLFEQRYGAEWRAFDACLRRLENARRLRGRLPFRRRRGTDGDGVDTHANTDTNNNAAGTLDVADFPVAYRRLCTQLALARERHYSSRLIDRLGQLALRGHQQLYRAPTDNAGLLAGVLHFVGVGFPRLVRREAPLFWLCGALFYGPLLLAGLTFAIDPSLIYTLLDPDTVGNIESMYEPDWTLGAERQADSDLAMFGFYIYNNIGIGFRTFAGGMLFGVGTLFILLFNGLYIGAVAGYLTAIGYGVTFYPFVIAHGAFELTAIVLAGVAGMRLGLALLSPGRYSRLQALKRASAGSVGLIYGVVALLLLAAFVEAFWSSQRQLPETLRYTVGALCWLTLAAYLLFAGRGGEPADRNADAD